MDTTVTPLPNANANTNFKSVPGTNATPVTTSNADVNQKFSRKSIVSPISPLSSYKGVIIAVCLGILLWLLMQWDHKDEFKHSFTKVFDTDKTKDTMYQTKEKLKDVNENVRKTYETTSDSLKTTLQDTVDKVKNAFVENKEKLKDTYDQKMNTMQENAQDNKQYVKEKLNGVKDTVQKTASEFQTKTKETIDNIKEQTQQTVDKAKETIVDTQDTIQKSLEMNGLVSQGHDILKNLFSSHYLIEKQIPTQVLSGAKAVVLVSLVKGGIGISGIAGSGILIARNGIGKWSGPVAIAIAGLDIGLNIGVEKSEHIIVLHKDESVRVFASTGQLRLGVDASIAVGPLGRDTSVAINVGDKGYTTTTSYSFSKGAFLGLSFEGQVIVIRHDCNENYYGKKVNPLQILDGTIKPPKNAELKEIYELIDRYVAKNLVYPEHNTEL